MISIINFLRLYIHFKFTSCLITYLTIRILELTFLKYMLSKNPVRQYMLSQNPCHYLSKPIFFLLLNQVQLLFAEHLDFVWHVLHPGSLLAILCYVKDYHPQSKINISYELKTQEIKITSYNLIITLSYFLISSLTMWQVLL